MSRRAHLRELTRHLRRYLAWRKSRGDDVFVPASADERAEFEARKEAHQKRQVDELRTKISGESSTPSPAAPGTEDGEDAPTRQLPQMAESREDAAPSPSSDEPAAAGNENEMTAATPVWKKHDAMHEIEEKKRQKAQKKAGGEDRRDSSADERPTSPPSGGGERNWDENPPETPAEKMDFLRDYLGACTRCPLHEGRTNIVFGDGDPSARLMFVGEGPGRQEDRQALPFVGPSGQLLTKMIEAMGLSRSEVYITNVVKCRPPKNRNPAPLEIRECAPFLKKQIEIIEPEVIVTVGKFASNVLLDNDDEALGRMRGRWHEHMGVAVMPTYHPAYLLRNEDNREFRERVWNDLQMVMAKLGLEEKKG